MGKAAKGKGKADNNGEATAEETLIEEESQRLRDRAISRGILSRNRAYPLSKLKASKTILKSDGKDIVKKGHRKNKYLFCFPGLVAPVSAGKLGDFSCLDSKNPILYIDFPQGRMKFFGTIVYPKNKYLSLQFSKGSGNIVCEDCFESLVVFSEAWWIGTLEDNPEELRLEMPEELKQDRRHQNCDFTGGAGRAPEQPSKVPPQKHLDNSEAALQQQKCSIKKNADSAADAKEEVPTPDRRLSSRTAGKKKNYAEDVEDEMSEPGSSSSSEEHSSEDGDDANDDETAEVVARSGSKRFSAIDLTSSDEEPEMKKRKGGGEEAAAKEQGKKKAAAVPKPSAKKNLKQANLSFFVKPKQKEKGSPMDED